MAYGQTGTGKTFTLGRLGDEDTSARRIMVSAMEDILENISPETDSVSVSYLQIVCAFGLYIWCAAADPADPGVFKSKKYINFPEHKKHDRPQESKLGGESTSSIHDANATTAGLKPTDKETNNLDTATKDCTTETKKNGCCISTISVFLICEDSEPQIKPQMVPVARFQASCLARLSSFKLLQLL